MNPGNCDNFHSGSPPEDFNPLQEEATCISDPSLDIDETPDDPDAGTICASLDFASLDLYRDGPYGRTPPNPRAAHREKQRKRGEIQKMSKYQNALKDAEKEQRKINECNLHLQMFGSDTLVYSDYEQGSEASSVQSVVGSIDTHRPRKKCSTIGRHEDRMNKCSINNSFTETDEKEDGLLHESRGRNHRLVVTELSESSLSVPSTASSSGAIKINTTNRFFSLHPKPVTNAKGLLAIPGSVGFSHSPSMMQLDCPEDRLQFFKTFSMLINIGSSSKKEKEVKSMYDRQISSDQEVWRNRLTDLLWLELQAKLKMITAGEQDNYLMKARQRVSIVIDELLAFRVTYSHRCSPEASTGSIADSECTTTHKNEATHCISLLPSPGAQLSSANHCICGLRRESLCSASTVMFGQCLKSDLKQQNEALLQLTRLMAHLEFAESLYPTLKSLARDHPRYTSDEFQGRLGTMCLWLNITKDMGYKLKQLMLVLQISKWENTPWECLDIECLDKLISNIRSIDEDETAINKVNEEEDEDGEEGEEDGDELVTGAVTQSLTPSLVGGVRRKSVRFDDIESPQPAGATSDSDSSEELTGKRPATLSTLSSMENLGMTSVYRCYVENTLKKTGMRKLRTRVKELLDGTLQRARHALLKSPNCLSGMPEMAPDHADALYSHGLTSQQFAELNLPSFKSTFLFLARIPLDVIHECLKLRLEQRPKKEPSSFILQPLIVECKEALHAAVIEKHYYLHMVSSVVTTLDSSETDMDQYEADMEKMLDVYFEYIQAWMTALQQLPELSKRLKNFLEGEWNFTKKICPSIRGGEAKAGKRFCLMASSLLGSISDFLEDSIDVCINQLYDTSIIKTSSPAVTPEKSPVSLFLEGKTTKRRQAIVETCRHFKEIFHEARERSSKALGFAKMLRNDLELAAEFNLADGLSAEELLEHLYQTNHRRVITANTNYLILIPERIADRKEKIRQLLNVTCGREDAQNMDDSSVEGYLILLKLEGYSEDNMCDVPWHGPMLDLELTAETTIALIHIEVNGLLFIVIHANQLLDQRREFQKLMNSRVILINEQKSCHQAITESLAELKNAAIDLRERVAKAIEHVDEKLNLDDLVELEFQEKQSIQQLYRETLHQCYNFGFEYHKEVTRLVSGEVRSKLSTALVDFANQWMKFVADKCERGRGIRPRWAGQGMDFLIVACEPRVLATLSNEQFAQLKSAINQCVTHVIGDKVTSLQTPGFRVGSPDVVTQRQMGSLLRNPSCPNATRQVSGTMRQTMPSDENAKSAPGTPSLAAGRQSTGRIPLPAPSGDILEEYTGISFDAKPVVRNRLDHATLSSPLTMPSLSIATDDDTGSVFTRNDSENIDWCDDNNSSRRSCANRTRVMLKQINILEQKRREKLTSERLIGRPTDHNREIDYQINVRRVTFKWQRGLMIGEGASAKVYNAVNMDNGVLMAMKEIRFQPNDHQSVKKIADELQIFERISHPNLVTYYGVEVHRDEMIIFMEYCPNGTIEEAARQGLEEMRIRQYTREILSAINMLHDNQIVHRDIKGANIFLTDDGHCRLGDFGVSVKLKNHTTLPGELKLAIGTPAFMAPEVINPVNLDPGRAADIWSLGCVVIEMTTGKRPWSELEGHHQIMFKVGMGGIPTIPDQLSEEGKEFLSYIFIVDPQKRWTASQLLSHQFLKVCDEEEPD